MARTGGLTAGVTGQEWRDDAACKGKDTAMFFGPEGRGTHSLDAQRQIAAAIAICRTCPVVAECAADADLRGEISQVRGGQYRPQRKGVRQRTVDPRAVEAVPAHGTNRRYHQGCSCAACRDAHRATQAHQTRTRAS